MTPYDAVLSYHTDPETCGTAKFNQQLARRLGVFFRSLDAHPCAHPLISIKPDEIEDVSGLRRVLEFYDQFGLFLHAPWPWRDLAHFLGLASKVYAANPAIAADIARYIPEDVQTVWCPSTIEPGQLEQERRAILTFGMLHKFDVARYTKLKALLDKAGEPYEILLSAAVHHGTPPEAWPKLIHAFEELWPEERGGALGRLTVLGHLSDTALIRELPRVVAIATFYDPAVRANNTTAWMAAQWGRCLITNLDAQSPDAFIHGETVYDVNQLTEWPTDKQRVAQNARLMADQFSWDVLAERFRA